MGECGRPCISQSGQKCEPRQPGRPINPGAVNAIGAEDGIVYAQGLPIMDDDQAITLIRRKCPCTTPECKERECTESRQAENSARQGYQRYTASPGPLDYSNRPYPMTQYPGSMGLMNSRSGESQYLSPMGSSGGPKGNRLSDSSPSEEPKKTTKSKKSTKPSDSSKPPTRQSDSTKSSSIKVGGSKRSVKSDKSSTKQEESSRQSCMSPAGPCQSGSARPMGGPMGGQQYNVEPCAPLEFARQGGYVPCVAPAPCQNGPSRQQYMQPGGPGEFARSGEYMAQQYPGPYDSGGPRGSIGQGLPIVPCSSRALGRPMRQSNGMLARIDQRESRGKKCIECHPQTSMEPAQTPSRARYPQPTPIMMNGGPDDPFAPLYCKPAQYVPEPVVQEETGCDQYYICTPLAQDPFHVDEEVMVSPIKEDKEISVGADILTNNQECEECCGMQREVKKPPKHSVYCSTCEV